MITNYENGVYKWNDLLQLIELEIGLRKAIVLLVGEEDDLSFRNFMIDNLEEFIAIKEGITIVTDNYSKIQEILKILENKDEDYKLGIALGYPKCCVEKWISFKNGEETAIHNTEMRKQFMYLSYIPCSMICEESLKREGRMRKIIGGE